MEPEENYLERASIPGRRIPSGCLPHAAEPARGLFFTCRRQAISKRSGLIFTERANLNSFLVVCTLSGEGRLQYEGREYARFWKAAYFSSIA